ncbi:ATP synthase subunit I [Tistrella mobilis]|jgi:F1F0 ATPase subunit 2|uniref:N-ATPase subunit AtpR n=1 Tax=Tistrella mobilis TaxID=171437 RepID=UPI003557A509
MNAFPTGTLSALASDLPALVLALAAGLIAGGGFFLLLRRNTGLFATGRIGLAVTMQIARFTVLVPVLVLAAREGAGPLLAAALGVVIARRMVVGRARRQSVAMLPDGGRSS